jgi:hypothetical protein
MRARSCARVFGDGRQAVDDEKTSALTLGVNFKKKEQGLGPARKIVSTLFTRMLDFILD